ncbi:MAG TPA: CoA-transferase [Jatrophihabitans sp.]|jgi:acyl CoA:acetate/3-ketoacid CoA transferase beta subunit|nr:CoA-transferase [Jatrophihabitans sp.]
MTATRAEVCAVACADLFAHDGEILASPMGTMPLIGARLARLTSNPDLLISDGEAYLLAETPPIGGSAPVEGWLPYGKVFDVVAAGTRHVVMGANQVDRFGNQNISCLGEHARPKRQMFGSRGAPGNTVNHRTSYWVAKHAARVFVPAVDVVSGVGYDRAVGAAGRFHDVHRVVTNLAVLDFATADRSMRIASVHPGVTIEQVEAETGFPLVRDDVATTREPTDEELKLLRDVLDPKGYRDKEVPNP